MIDLGAADREGIDVDSNNGDGVQVSTATQHDNPVTASPDCCRLMAQKSQIPTTTQFNILTQNV